MITLPRRSSRWGSWDCCWERGEDARPERQWTSRLGSWKKKVEFHLVSCFVLRITKSKSKSENFSKYICSVISLMRRSLITVCMQSEICLKVVKVIRNYSHHTGFQFPRFRESQGTKCTFNILVGLKLLLFAKIFLHLGLIFGAIKFFKFQHKTNRSHTECKKVQKLEMSR